MYPIRLTGGSTDRTVAHLHSLAAMDRNYVTNEVSVSDDGSGTYLFQLRHSQDFSYLAGHSAIGASLYVTLDHYCFTQLSSSYKFIMWSFNNSRYRTHCLKNIFNSSYLSTRPPVYLLSYSIYHSIHISISRHGIRFNPSTIGIYRVSMIDCIYGQSNSFRSIERTAGWASHPSTTYGR